MSRCDWCFGTGKTSQFDPCGRTETEWCQCDVGQSARAAEARLQSRLRFEARVREEMKTKAGRERLRELTQESTELPPPCRPFPW